MVGILVDKSPLGLVSNDISVDNKTDLRIELMSYECRTRRNIEDYFYEQIKQTEAKIDEHEPVLKYIILRIRIGGYRRSCIEAETEQTENSEETASE